MNIKKILVLLTTLTISFCFCSIANATKSLNFNDKMPLMGENEKPEKDEESLSDAAFYIELYNYINYGQHGEDQQAVDIIDMGLILEMKKDYERNSYLRHMARLNQLHTSSVDETNPFINT